MKNFFTTVAVAAIFLLFGCNNSGNDKAITLKFNLPAGSNYDYNVDMDMGMKGNVNGQALNMKNQMDMGYHFAAKADSAGWKKIQATISRIAMNLNSNGMNINYDSDKASDTTDVVSNTMGKVLGAIKGGEFYFTINSKGEVGAISGVDDMMQRAMSSVKSPGDVAMTSGVGNTFNEENFKQNIQQSFAMYPDKPVKPGDTWTNTTTMNMQTSQMKIDNTYTLESVTGNNADVKVDSKISSAGSGSSMGITGTMNGNMKFDIPSGMPLNGKLDMNMTMTMNTGGQVVPMTTDIKMKITGKQS